MILVFDTSTSHLTIGLASRDGELLATFEADATPTERGVHDARLASGVEALLKRINRKPSELQRIGLIIGPGSFTGLRIGLSFGKGLASALDIPVIPLTQHEVLKAGASESFDHILTPGYQPALAYLSTFEAPNDIRLVNSEEIRAIQGKFLVESSVPESVIGDQAFIRAPLSLESLAGLTVTTHHSVGREVLPELEPLYVTEFQTGKR
jgi:tRNA threonylcarbamoyladenosine biosynthesis protein TsaB